MTFDERVAAVCGLPTHDCNTAPDGPIDVSQARQFAQLHNTDGQLRCLHRQAGIEALRDAGLMQGGKY